MARVAVIILNWNGEKLLREFLPSVVKYTDPGLGRIVVADNASEDDSVRILEQEFPEVELIRFSQNHGFAGGYNRAVGLVPEEIVVLLNSDVEVAPGWLEPLVAIRAAIHSAWDNRDESAWNQVFHTSGPIPRPTNSAIISLLAEQLGNDDNEAS